MDQLDLIDICRTFHPKTMNFTFFSSAHGTFSKIEYILGHKSNLGLKKIKTGIERVISLVGWLSRFLEPWPRVLAACV